MRPVIEILNSKHFKANRVMEDGEDLRIDGNFFDPVTQKKYYCIFTTSMGWEHASVSQPNRTPTWDIMWWTIPIWYL